MKDSKVRQYSRKIGMNLWVLDYYFKELQENLLPIVKDEEERELLPTTKNTEINLWMIDHYFNELQDNLIPLKIKYMEAEDEEEKEEIVHDAIHQIYSTRGIKTMYSETDQELLEKSILLFKILLEDDNTLDNQVQPELFELLYNYSIHLNNLKIKYEDKIIGVEKKEYLDKSRHIPIYTANDGKKFRSRERVIVHNKRLKKDIRERLLSNYNNKSN